MSIRSIGLAAAILAAGAVSSQASTAGMPAMDRASGLAISGKAMALDVAPGIDPSLTVARRGADDPPGDDRGGDRGGKHHGGKGHGGKGHGKGHDDKGHDDNGHGGGKGGKGRGGHDDGPNHT